MLSKTDLANIKSIIREEVTAANFEFNSVIDEKLRPIDKNVKRIKSNIAYLKKTVDIIAKNYDRNDTNLNKRVKSIENHLGLTPQNI